MSLYAYRLLTVFVAIWSMSLPATVHAQPVAVDVVSTKAIDSQKLVSLSGTVEAHQNANLATLQAGVVAEIFVEVGDRVQAGQKLLEIDNTLAQLDLSQAKADVDAALIEVSEAKRQYQESVTLSKQQLVPATQLQERRALIATAESKLARLKAHMDLQQAILQQHTLYAPFNGIISERLIDVGEWVTQQSATFTLVEQNRLRVRVAIPQEYYGLLASNHNVAVTVLPDFTGAQPIATELDRLVTVSNRNTRALLGYVNLPINSPLLAGMSATVNVQLPTAATAVVWLPKQAVKQHPDGGFSVFAVVDSKAKRYIVDVVQQKQQQMGVVGIPTTHPIVVSAVELLKDGEPVTINDDNQGGQP
ncbi:efflux RND transporter periplasmic adaptor subunit [Thalassotalea ponticola]|uniref:efflux RND transporter periplasmic adaptor subunit n=1 Tax=Thalassotalea ponticola TaxID=1523392 RepID=UPI0025B2F8CC|nr:efflux RND transporter periplasmic adaptor subunit [Thalassotalea ponticola]MDN3653312.1 efflux RND transporter periplasmic adaptor subunit [Thalassotalea ponticola]